MTDAQVKNQTKAEAFILHLGKAFMWSSMQVLPLSLLLNFKEPGLSKKVK